MSSNITRSNVKQIGSIDSSNANSITSIRGSSRDIEAGEQITIIDTEKPLVISYLEMATNNNIYVQLRLREYEAEYPIANHRILNHATQVTRELTAYNIYASPDGLWKILHYDTEEDQYKFFMDLKFPLFFPSGGEILIVNTHDTDTHKFNVKLIGRELE